MDRQAAPSNALHYAVRGAQEANNQGSRCHRKAVLTWELRSMLNPQGPPPLCKQARKHVQLLVHASQHPRMK